MSCLVVAAVLVLSACSAAGPEPLVAELPATLPEPSKPAPVSEVPPFPIQLGVPHLLEYENSNASLLAARVFPVGFSAAGLFAYAYEPPDEACGCYFFRLIVQDLNDNRVVWEHSYDSDPNDEATSLNTLEELWRARGAALMAELTSMGIVRHDSPTLRGFDASPEGLHVLFHTLGMEDESVFGFRYLSGYVAELVGPTGSEMLFRGGPREGADSTGLPHMGPLEVEAPGYILSPDGSRMVVLIQETWRGWEGPPHVAQLRFAGATVESPAKSPPREP